MYENYYLNRVRARKIELKHFENAIFTVGV